MLMFCINFSKNGVQKIFYFISAAAKGSVNCLELSSNVVFNVRLTYFIVGISVWFATV